MSSKSPGGSEAQPLHVFNGGFLKPRIRRILTLAGHPVRTGWPGPGDSVAVWGHAGTAWRGERVAARTGAGLVRIEDAFLRSLHPGRRGEPPVGLVIDRRGMHYDARQPSDLETLLATAPLDDSAVLDRARDAMAALANHHLTKYAAVDPGVAPPPPGYVLVIDQTRGDASIRLGGATAQAFAEMLTTARLDHPGTRIVIKTHPETAAGLRPGHLGMADTDDRISLFDAPISPWTLFEGAVAVYAVTSQLGFEAIFAGHRPHLFGQPFYAGWGLTEDTRPIDRRRRRLTRAQLFAAAMMLYPVWYDPFRDRLCGIEEVIDGLAARAAAWRADRRGHVAVGMRLWKRGSLQEFFGGVRPLLFEDDPARATDRARTLERDILVWASRDDPKLAASRVARVEDGLLRSRGLGAALTPPLSLVTDDLGIYYDPARESRLERLVADSLHLPAAEIRRAERLIAALTAANLTKYNLGGSLPDLPAGRRLLVPGQVADDASIRRGTDRVVDNAALLSHARAANPAAILLYKPHPDVVAGLRPGAIDAREADAVLDAVDTGRLLGQVDGVVTMTSTLGFEALMRGVPVTCLGAPFYAGWGLTNDLGRTPERRRARPSLAQFVHAALIGYPRYRDPVTGLPCTVEIVVDRLAEGRVPAAGPGLRTLSKLQGLLATRAHLWRR